MVSRAVRDKLDEANQAYWEDDRERLQAILEEVHRLLENDPSQFERFMSEDD